MNGGDEGGRKSFLAVLDSACDGLRRAEAKNVLVRLERMDRELRTLEAELEALLCPSEALAGACR